MTQRRPQSAPTPVAAPELLCDVFLDTVRSFPNHVAIDVPPGRDRPRRKHITYRDLAAEVARISRRIRPWIVSECAVGILLPRDSHLLVAAELAVLSAGGAHVCCDVGFPDDHINYVFGDAGAVAVLTDSDGRARIPPSTVPEHRIIDVTRDLPVDSDFDLRDLHRPEWVGPSTMAYIIYTSGTTGRPKGVVIEHGSIAHLIREEIHRFGLQPRDRIAQLSSPAYDSSVAEIWMPLAVGAALVILDDDATRLGPDLIAWLREERVTVLMPTPTMLATTGCSNPGEELPDLRLVYVGGEAIPQELSDRWSSGTWLENGYGPTECTVVVTSGRLRPGAPVTIGTAIPGSTAWVLDASLEPVADGEQGELCIAGIGLARGYLGRPELTAERFPVHPELGRIYRTGDLVCREPDGRLTYCGRIDTQVKIRGHRIELEAIEARLAELDGVRAAACRVDGSKGHEHISAFVVPRDHRRPPLFGALAEQLRMTLPAVMVPQRFAIVDELPTSVSGKLDRGALPEIVLGPTVRRALRAPRTELEALVVSEIAACLEVGEVSVDDDFFDLGGTSLRAAELISRLRRHAATSALAVRDVYRVRTAEALAREAEARGSSAAEAVDGDHGAGRPVLVTLAQAAWLSSAVLVAAPIAYALIYHVLPILVESFGLVAVLLLLPFAEGLLLAVYLPLSVAVTILTKRLLIGRYTSRREPVWGSFYLRNWIVQRAAHAIPWRFLQGTVFLSSVLRALGARVGARVHIHRGVDLANGGWDLLEIGDDVTISQDAAIGLVELDRGQLVVGPVRIAHGATLEVRAGVSGDTEIGANAILAPLSALGPGQRIPAGELWDGVPARRAGAAAEPPELGEPQMDPARHGFLLMAARFGVGTLLWLPFVAIAAALVVLLQVTGAAALEWLYAPVSLPRVLAIVLGSIVVSLPLGLFLQALVLRLLPKVPSGTHGRFTARYVLIWLRTGLLESAGNWLAGSLYWRWWLRLAGMRLGSNTEVSTIIDVLPENISIGAESFFADGVYLGGPRLRRGTVTTAATSFGENTFLGNHVVIPAGTELPDDILLGVCTVADARIRRGTSWFGHPPFELPRREVVELDRRLTHEPGLLLFANRLIWETLRFALPAIATAALLGWLAVVTVAATELAVPVFLAVALPAITIAAPSALALLVVVLKWMLLGRVRPGQHGLWSAWCCRWDFLYMAWDRLARGSLAQLGGTLLLPWYLRVMGVRIGRRVVLAGGFAQIVDPDMLTFEDGATVDAMFQAHSFEDRVLKIDRVRIRAGATVRRAAVLMYGADLGDRCWVAPHSVVMKNEHLLPERAYEGVPTEPR